MPSASASDIRDKARGRWRDILIRFKINPKMLTRKHGPCPLCGGRDRFRFDNKDGRGTWFCNVCGSSDGFGLIMRITGWDFNKTVNELDKIVKDEGFARVQPVNSGITDEFRKYALRDLWKNSVPMREGDRICSYFEARRLPTLPSPALRFAKTCPLRDVPGTEDLPAMLGVVSGPDGKPTSLHRTYLDPENPRQADIIKPKRMMPGALPKGSAVRLCPLRGDVLGIAEGIETAVAASSLFNVPVWAATTAAMLESFIPPAEVRRLLVFGDNDANYTGHKAAYALAQPLAIRGEINVTVHIPDKVGEDWADVLYAHGQNQTEFQPIAS